MKLEKTTKDLIKIASLSGHERNLADYIFTSLVVCGLKPIKQSGNVLLHIKGSDSTKAVIFDSHMDTISPGALSLWKYPPYGKDAGIQEDDKIYGLGASDCKSGISVLLTLAQKLHSEMPAIDTWFVFAIKEEVGGDGTKNFLDWFEKNDYLKKYSEISAVICEPTDMREIRLGHRGNFNAQIVSRGKSGHGSEPHEVKDQAIFQTLKIIEALNKLEKIWQKKYQDEVLGMPSIAITSINGGEFISPNKFPDNCSITIDVRTTKKLDKVAFGLIKSCVEKYGADIKVIYNPAPPGYTDPRSKIALAGKKLIGKIAIGKISTDLCFFSELGIPGIILGPGSQDSIHKPNEYCEISKLEKALSIYEKIINLL